VNFIASHALARSQQQLQSTDTDSGGVEDDNDAMAALERQARAPIGFVIATSSSREAEVGALKRSIQEGGVASNPDALDVSLDD
jgi:pre-mRNA-splicing factor SYF1